MLCSNICRISSDSSFTICLCNEVIDLWKGQFGKILTTKDVDHLILQIIEFLNGSFSFKTIIANLSEDKVTHPLSGISVNISL